VTTSFRYSPLRGCRARPRKALLRCLRAGDGRASGRNDFYRTLEFAA
jgi:hypothetical protein